MSIRVLPVLVRGGFAAACLALAACNSGSSSGGGGGGNNGGGNGGGGGPATGEVRTFEVCTGPDARDQALLAFFEAREGDTIQFCAGSFQFPTGLILNSKRGITIRGAGKDQTLLSFLGSDSSEGINVSHSDGIVIQGLTVEDTPGNAIRIYRSRYVTLRDVRSRWSDADPAAAGYQPAESNGAYGLYPVECQHVLIEDSESIGASDAGIYVGQTSDVVVRNTRAEYNVAGFEFENTYRAVFEDNVATNNTGGFLVFDLPGLAQYGQKNVVRRNRSFANNTDNFAPIGNIVGLTPRGTGMLILATDQLEIYDNEITDNDTVGIALVNFALADPAQPDRKYDFFPEGVHIHNNLFRDNGGNPQTPDLARGEASLLPTILQLKNFGRTSHIVWDGAVDKPNGCTEFPKDRDGVPLNQPNPQDSRAEPRLDERGRPNFQRSDPEPSCKYNAWKFDGNGQLKLPENGLCIEDNNVFESSSAQTALVTPFLNAHLTSSDPARLVLDLLVPGSNDLTPHRCTLPPRPAPVLQLPFVPNPANGDARPTDSEVAAACNGGTAGQVNFAALARYNCPRLDQYRLFSDPQDPRSAPNGGGVPFELNSALFSDYAVKYRVLYLPPGTQASYRDHNNGATATLDFPVNTVIAKTFAFRKGAVENVVETRLLIRRQTAGGISWIGLPYIWRKDAQGSLDFAELKVQGGSTAVEYDFDDPDPEVLDAGGQRAHYQGAVAQYGIPASLNCVTCHGNDDREAGAAPIGLKPRYLNRNHVYGGQSVNQLAYLAQQGLLSGLPANLAEVERHPRWNVPGDGGSAAGSDEDIHARARAYIEVNCLHCHNANGNASNSGLFLDAFRTVNSQYGICKKPVAAGRGSGGRLYDIVPGSADDSILSFRVGSSEAGVRMPPLARTVTHAEAYALLNDWISDVLPTPDTEDEEVCTGPLAGLPLLGGGSTVPFLGALPVNDLLSLLSPLLESLTQLSSADQRRAAP